jgi:hypothetical protein
LEALTGTEPSACYPKGGLFPLRAGESLEEDEMTEYPDSSTAAEEALTSGNPLQLEQQQPADQNDMVQATPAEPATAAAEAAAAAAAASPSSSSWLGGMFSKKEIAYEKDR